MPKRRPAALFDYDYTLLNGESLRLFMPHVIRRYRRSLLEMFGLAMLVVPYKMKRVTKERMKTRALRILRYVPDQDREALIREFCSQVLGPRHYPRGLERIRWHKQQGHRLILASASVDTYLTEVQRLLGFDVLVCTRTDPGDLVAGTNCYGQEKLNRLQELDFFDSTDWESSWAYSDHISDLPMMSICGHPVATNPKKALRAHARNQGWEIADW